MFNQPKGVYMALKQPSIVPLDDEVREALPTSEAARHLNRASQTLYLWNHNGTYPACLKPRKVRGRLAWPVSGIRQLLQGGAA